MEAEVFLPDLGRATVSPRTRTVAILTAVVTFAIGIVAILADEIPVTKFDGFAAVCATIWFGASALTALLLFGQFFITRAIGFLIHACAFQFAALLMIPYVASVYAFGLDPQGHLADRQVTGALWTVWHLMFPLLVACGLALDPDLVARPPASISVGRTMVAATVVTSVVTAAIVAAIWIWPENLPIVVVAGEPTPYYRFNLSREVAILNGVVCLFALGRGRGTTLGIWLALALFSASLNAIVNGFSAHTFSLGWYLAKAVTTLTASVVFTMLLLEIATLYRRLADLATRDPLTGLRNRRGLEEYLAWTFARANRQKADFGVLVIDVDHFKRFNDRYGHVAGDLALRRVADLLTESTIRRDDLAARYGGEEFVIGAYDVTLEQTIAIAERLRERLGEAHIANAGGELGRLSVSIGIAHSAHTPLERLFAAADSALYRAKEAGRDRWYLSDDSSRATRELAGASAAAPLAD